jgi:hypothetical protein
VGNTATHRRRHDHGCTSRHCVGHRAHKIIYDWMAQQPKLPSIGLSATPWTKGLGRHYNELIIAATTQQLIREGYLAPFRVFAPSHTGHRSGPYSGAHNRPEAVARWASVPFSWPFPGLRTEAMVAQVRE